MHTYSLFIYALSALALLMFTLVSVFVIRRHLKPASVFVLAGALLLSWVLYGLNVRYIRNSSPDTFMEWFIHLNEEGNFTNSFSSLMLLSAAMVSIIVLLLKRPIQRDNLFWLGSSVLSAMMTYDEWFSPSIRYSPYWKLIMIKLYRKQDSVKLRRYR